MTAPTVLWILALFFFGCFIGSLVSTVYERRRAEDRLRRFIESLPRGTFPPGAKIVIGTDAVSWSRPL